MKLEHLFLLMTVAAGLAGHLTQPSWAQQPPDFPDIEQLVRARRAIGAQGLKAEVGKYEAAIGKRGWFRRLFIDNVTGTVSYGRGLKVTNENDAEVITALTRAEWSGIVTFKLPLNTAFQVFSGYDVTQLDLEIARAKYEEALLAEEIEIREMYNEFLRAKADYESGRQEGDTASAGSRTSSKPAFEMRGVALKLLILTGYKPSQYFSQWSGFVPGTGDSTPRIARNTSRPPEELDR